MRTSYQKSQTESNMVVDLDKSNVSTKELDEEAIKELVSSSDEVDLAPEIPDCSMEENVIKSRIREAYYDIDYMIDMRRQDELDSKLEELECSNDLVEDEDSDDYDDGDYEDDYKEDEDYDDEVYERKPGKKGYTKVFVAIFAVLVILGGSYFFLSLGKGTKSIEDVQVRVDRMYTNSKKEDIKDNITMSDLEDCYIKLSELAKKDEDTKDIESELNSIGYFLSDKNALDSYDDDDYDLTTPELVTKLNIIKENTKSYSVSGLAVTINDLATSINSDYDYFINLRSELNGVTDPLVFDENQYKQKINEVTHKSNKEELNSIYSKLLADKTAAIAEQKLKEAATAEAQEQAQKALDEAKQLQEKTQQEFDSLKQKLADKLDELGEEDTSEQQIQDDTTAEESEGSDNGGITQFIKDLLDKN